MKDLKYYCDTCEKEIVDFEKGWVEWLEDFNTGECSEFRICHHTKECQVHSHNQRRDFLLRHKIIQEIDLYTFLKHIRYHVKTMKYGVYTDKEYIQDENIEWRIL